MSVNLWQLESRLNELLRPERFSDYCPNGLQVEGSHSVNKIVSGVTACQALIDAAIEQDADMLLVHHGYFWRGEDQALTGMKRRRVQSLLNHQINLFAYHLPLDVHPEFGNNVQLARLLEIEVEGVLDERSSNPLVFHGRLKRPMSHAEFCAHLAANLGRNPVAVAGRTATIESIAWCTGAAQNYIDYAVTGGVDAYLTGEISEPSAHIARETGLHFFSAGHHATERYGVQALGKLLADEFHIPHQFVDIDNPA